jgi:hypothetical protein
MYSRYTPVDEPPLNKLLSGFQNLSGRFEQQKIIFPHPGKKTHFHGLAGLGQREIILLTHDGRLAIGLICFRMITTEGPW